MTAMPPARTTDLSWLLSDLAARVPHTRSVQLLTSDGLVKATHELSTDDAEHLAAVTSGLYSLARSAGQRFDNGEEPRQVVVELDAARLFVSAAGQGACLAVLAGREADVEVLAYEMAMLVKSVRPFLATPTREREAAPTP